MGTWHILVKISREKERDVIRHKVLFPDIDIEWKAG